MQAVNINAQYPGIPRNDILQIIHVHNFLQKVPIICEAPSEPKGEESLEKRVTF